MNVNDSVVISGSRINRCVCGCKAELYIERTDDPFFGYLVTVICPSCGEHSKSYFASKRDLDMAIRDAGDSWNER